MGTVLGLVELCWGWMRTSGVVGTVLGLVELCWGWMRTSGNCFRASGAVLGLDED